MKLDSKLTRNIQDWLNTPANLRDIPAGATMLLSLSHNKALYNSIMSKPDKFAAKLEYELRKFLKMRIADMAVSDVVKMEAAVMPAAAETLSAPPMEIPVDAELLPGVTPRGRRPDHDSLPPEIKDLWDSNGVRYHRIRLLFSELKAMSGALPCDRYEKLTILDTLDKEYRASLERYDSYVAGGDHTDVVTDNTRTVANARKTMSKYRKLLSTLPEDSDNRVAAIGKIADAAGTIIACGAGLSVETIAELTALGISLS